MIKRTIACILTAVMVFTVLPMTGLAVNAENDQISQIDTDCSIKGNNSFGTVMADAFNDYGDGDSAESNCYVTDITVDERKDIVTVETGLETDSQIAVGIYDDSGEKLLFSQTVTAEDDGSTDVQLQKSLPDYFVVKAVEVDGNGRAVGGVFVDQTQTKRYEAFKNTTSDDYADKRVINLDEDETDNFLVISSEAQVLTQHNTVLKQTDETQRIYTFNKSKETKNLSDGDVFVFNADNLSDIVIGKVADVEIGKDTVTVRAEEAKLDETFEVVKIHLEDDFVKLAEVESQNASGNSKRISKVDYHGDLPVSKTFPFSFGPVKGSATVSANVHVDFEYDLKLFGKDWAYFKLTTSPTASIQASINYDYNKEFSLGNLSASLWGGAVSIGIEFKVVIKASVKISFSASISATYGFQWDTNSGKKNLNTTPVVNSSVEIDGSFYLGLKVIPNVGIAWGLAKATIVAEAGGKISAHAGWNYETGQTSKHDCGLACIYAWIDIPVSVKATLTINIFGWKPVDKEWNLWSKTFSKVYDFHYSIKYREFGRGECGHQSYLITFKVLNQDGKPISGASVDGNRTGGDGITKAWFSDGKHKIKVTASGYVSKSASYGFSGPKTITIRMKKGSSSQVEDEVDSSYSSYTKRYRSSANGYGGGTYVAPLTYTEPEDGVVLSTRLAGQRRSDVAWVQRELKNLGYNITADGYYGNLTANVVSQFQRDYDLPVTGTVNANVVAVIKKPIKAVTAPVLRLTTNPDIASGGIVSVSWDGVANASEYNVYAYNSSGQLAASAVGTKANNASFVLYDAGEYTIKAVSVNDRFTSNTAELNQRIHVHNPCLVTFVDWDGTILSKQFVEFGKSAVTPASPDRDGYTFSKWDKAYTNLTDSELTVTAQYTRNRYTVKFMDVSENGSEKVLISDSYYFGEAAQAPDASSLSVPQGYKFIGWDKDFSNITEDITVKPVLEWENDDLPILIESYNLTKDQGYGYNVSLTVRNFDKQRTTGRVVVALKTESGRFITMTESSAFTLSKSNSSSGIYSRETLSIFVPCNEAAAYADVFVVANYNALIPISEVKRCETGETTGRDSAENNTIAGKVDSDLAGKQAILFIYKIDEAADFTNEYIGQTVIGADGSYTFDYRLREEPTPETGDYTVVLGIEGADGAIFLDTIKAPRSVFTVTIKDFDGSVLDTQTVFEGDSAVLPANNPEREGYRFAGWDYSNSSIHEDLTITAIYVPKTYTVVFIDWTNERFDMKTYQHGEAIDSRDLSLNSLEDYDAIGWEGVTEGMKVTQNMVVTAKYQKKQFSVKFYDCDGNIIDEQIVAYGEDVKAPAIESDDIHIVYGWDADKLFFVTKPVEVHPFFSYTETTETPTPDYGTGIYENTVTVNLSCATADAEIYYSINGENYALYTSPITISQTSELSAYASSFGKNDSNCITEHYVINRAGDEENWRVPVHVYKGNELMGTYVVPFGGKIDATSLPVTLTGYNLEGFFYDSEFQNEATDNNANAETTVYAKLVPETFTVTFKDINGDVVDTKTVSYLEAADAPDMLASVGDLIFVGWDTDDYLCVTDNVIASAVYINEDEFVGITLNREAYNMMEGYTYTLTAQTTGSGITEVFWESSDERVATVDTNGKITAINDGIAIITATALGETVASASCYLTVVTNPAMSITLNQNSNYTIAQGHICGISPSNNTVTNVSTQIRTESIKFFDGETEIAGDDLVKTGCTVSYYDNNGNELDTMVLVVIGDVDGDGFVTNRDTSHIMRQIIGKEILETGSLFAADVNADGSVNNKDASLIARVVAQKESI